MIWKRKHFSAFLVNNFENITRQKLLGRTSA
jgi:hypothetical protein